MTQAIVDQVPPRQLWRPRDRLCDPPAVQREPHPVRQSRARQRRTARADRPRGNANLCRAVRGGRAMGQRVCLARPQARRPHPAVPRRHAGLSGSVFRRGPRRLRAAADQHADAAGSAAVLSRRFRRSGRGGRCRVRLALRRASLQGHAAHHADRGQRRPRARTLRRTPSPRPIGCRAFRRSLRKPTRPATTWRSGCTPPARPGGPRASCICSTTWPIPSSPSPATC